MLPGSQRRFVFPPLLSCVPATPPWFNNLYSRQSRGVGKQLPPTLPVRWVTRSGGEGEKVPENDTQSPLDLSAPSRILPQTATDEQQNTETLNEYTRERKGEKPACDQKSTKKLEAEIC